MCSLEAAIGSGAGHNSATFTRTIVALLMFVIGSVANTPAQGPFQFGANLILIEPVPPNTNDWGGPGTFTLTGNTLSCRVAVAPYGPWARSEIRAFATDGPALFDLALLGCVPPLGRDPGACVFRSTLTVPDPGIPDLMANNWYVTATFQGIDGEVNVGGRIVLVPEPSGVALLALGGATLIAWFCISRSRRQLVLLAPREPPGPPSEARLSA
jgi:hypothetical protein